MSEKIRIVLCQDCVFRNEDDDTCRRHAPKAIASAFLTKDSKSHEFIHDAVWPMVLDGDWCGEGRARA